MSWDNMSEKEKYYRRKNVKQQSDDIASLSILGIPILAILIFLL